MRAQGLLLALLCLMGYVGYCGTLSTCKPLNLELVKRKRIEAIRGQILSKLQLDKEPEDDDKGEGDEVPAEVLSVYNSTVELNKDLMQITDHVDSSYTEEEAYYAKEVHKFNMTKIMNDTVMLFNVTAMRDVLGLERMVSQAELRLLIKDPRLAPGNEERLELYHGAGDKARYLNSQSITNDLNGKWISFDVTQTVKNWLQNPEAEKALQVKLHCGCGENDNKISFISVLSFSVSSLSLLYVLSRQSDVCCVRRLYIDFRKDLGWKWIHEPSGYYANYCIGSCSFVWNAENKYSQVLALYKHHNPGASAQPCCVPQVLDPLPILYYVGRQHKPLVFLSFEDKNAACYDTDKPQNANWSVLKTFPWRKPKLGSIWQQCQVAASSGEDPYLSAALPVTKGYSSMEVNEMEELRLSNPPMVEQSVAHHLHLNRRSTLYSCLPGQMEHFTASMYQKILKSTALAVRALNATSMLMAYQAKLLEELGTQLDSRNPNPAVWEEICNSTELNLRTSRGALQSCERSLWLNLSSIGDREKLDFLNAPRDFKGLFGPAVAAMKQRCDLQKKEGEAFNVCLPQRKTPHPPAPPRPVPPTQSRRFLSAPRIAKPQGTEQSAWPQAAPSVNKGKGRELADMMERRKVAILCVQETRWKGSKARSIGAGFKLFYYGVDSKRNGVGVVLKEEFVRNVLEVKRVSDRVMSLKLEIEGVMLNVVSGYAPQVGCELEEKERFWSELDEVMESIPTGERVVIGADFNGHVGEGNRGDEEVMGKFGVKERNLEGQMVVDFAKRMDMAVVNTYFQKREEHRVTYKSGEEEVKDRNREEKLTKEECCEEFRQKLRQALGGQVVLPDDWETTAEVIRETGRKVLGVSSGRRKEDKETWWWNEEVQDSIQRKRLAKKKWDMDRTEENRQEYKELQRRVKREVSKAKQKAYDELYTRLDTREGEKDLYRLARQRDRDGKDV
ncbi:hypothetical protein QTP86_000904 [Hemibagrus guttatus]|nr:hypothetical protein QTP86_000904 [Hemibagrus guttatus]